MKAKIEKLSKLNDNQIYELLSLLNEVEKSILCDYCHVSDYLPSVLIDTIQKLQNDLSGECDKRNL